MSIHTTALSPLGLRAKELYERHRLEIETPENIGKLIVIEDCFAQG